MNPVRGDRTDYNDNYDQQNSQGQFPGLKSEFVISDPPCFFLDRSFQ